MALAQKNHLNPVLLILLAWLIPGAGHFRLQKKFRAAAYAVSVGVLFWLGLYLQGYFTFPSTPNESFAWFKFTGAIGSGLHFPLALFFKLGTGDLDVYRAAFTNEYGNTCLYSAGIINLLAVIDSLDIRYGRKS